MHRDPKAYFAEMLKAVATIQSFTDGRDFQEFEKVNFYARVFIGNSWSSVRHCHS